MSLLEIPNLQPRLKVLNREQALAIHTAALEILEKIGIKMEHPGALEMLADAGGRSAQGGLRPWLLRQGVRLCR